MGHYTPLLRHLAQNMLSWEEQKRLLDVLLALPLSFDALAEFDDSLGGPSIDRVTVNSVGYFEVQDRDIFRPLQYCAMYLHTASEAEEGTWLTRGIVHMSGLHLETTLKRVGRINMPWSLGKLLNDRVVQRKLDPFSWSRISSFLEVYNAAKHDVDHPKDSHLFSLEDAALAYVVSRRLAQPLYPLARLHTNMAQFSISYS